MFAFRGGTNVTRLRQSTLSVRSPTILACMFRRPFNPHGRCFTPLTTISTVMSTLASPPFPTVSMKTVNSTNSVGTVNVLGDRVDAIRKTLHVLVAEQTRRTPDAIAIETDTHIRLSYKELDDRVQQLAQELRVQHVLPGQFIGLYMERGLDVVVAMLAILHCGAAFMPLDVSTPVARLRTIMKESKCLLILTHSAHVANLDTLDVPALPLDRIERHVDVASTSLSESSAMKQGGGLLESDTPYSLLFTSGSTGVPKGVLNLHRGITNMIWNMQQQFALSDVDHVMFSSAHVFDVSMMEIFWPLVTGARLCIAPPRATQLPSVLTSYMMRARVTVAQFVPGVLSNVTSLVEAKTLVMDANKGVPLRALFNCGEALSERLCRRILDVFPTTLEFWNLYGPTETSIQVSAWNCRHLLKTGDSGKVQVGYPFQGVYVYVLDDQQHPVKRGELGELWISGVQTSPGYLNRLAETKSKFIADPFCPPSSLPCHMYATGDVGRILDDGCIEHHGRMDHQVKIRGYRVELGEIERVLEQHALVSRAVCVKTGTDISHERLVVYFIPSMPAHGKQSYEQLFAVCRDCLPAYMVPNTLVPVSHFAYTISGKLDRKQLPDPSTLECVHATPLHPDRNAGGAPVKRSTVLAEEEKVDPRVMSTVTDCFTKLIGEHHHALDLAPDSHFLQLGGNSIGLTRLIAQLSTKLGVSVDEEAVWQLPTIQEIARLYTLATRGDTRDVAVVSSRVTIPEPLSHSAIDEKSVFPLADVQQRLWFIHQLFPSLPLYNIPMAWHWTHHVNVDRLAGAFHKLVARHPAFRLAFYSRDGVPEQCIRSYAAHHVQFEQGYDPEITPAAAKVQISKFCARPFDIADGMLIRALLIKVNDQCFYFALSLHHLACDGWSMGLIVKELMELYRGESPTVVVSHQPGYQDYVAWQSNAGYRASQSASLAHWNAHLMPAIVGPAPPLALPTDFARPKTRSYKGDTFFFHLGPTLTAALRRFNVVHGSSTFLTMWSAFVATLSRYTQQQDIVIGCPIANRPHPSLESIVGFFANTLALRSRLSADTSFLDLIRSNRKTAIDAQQYQNVSFDTLVREANQHALGARLADRELFQAMFVCQNNHNWNCALAQTSSAAAAGGANSSTWIPISTGTSKFELLLQVIDVPDIVDLPCYLEYATDLFERKTVESLVNAFITLLTASLEQPQQRLTDVPVLLQPATLPVVHDDDPQWHRRWTRASPDLLQQVHKHVAATPRAPAVWYQDRCLTYAELWHRTGQVASFLTRRKLPRHSIIGVLAERSLEFVVACIGILRAGHVLLALDACFPDARLAAVANDAGIRTVLYTRAQEHRTINLMDRTICPRVLLALPHGKVAASPVFEQSNGNDPSGGTLIDSRDPAYIVYTSGTTGKPKGIVVPHSAWSNYQHHFSRHFRTDHTCRFLQLAAHSFDVYPFELATPLLHGGQLIMVAPGVQLDPLQLLDTIRRRRATSAFFVPQILKTMLDSWNDVRRTLPPETVNEHLHSLVDLYVGGESVTPLLLRQVWHDLGAHVNITNMYGPSEVPFSAFYDCRHRDVRGLGGSASGSTTSAPARIPIGNVIQNVDAYVLDKHKRRVIPGAVGQLCLGGAVGLASHYIGLEAETRRKFIPDPFRPKQVIYQTGDLVRVRPESGLLEYIGRNDHQVKLHGVRIETDEVERVILDCAAGVTTAVAIKRVVSGTDHLVAYISHCDDPDKLVVIKRALAARLQRVMVPTYIVPLVEFPTGTSGKVCRDERILPPPSATHLTSAIDAVDIKCQAPDSKRPELDPLAPLHIIVRHAWSVVLELPEESISLDEAYLTLGGHSLSSVRVLAHIQMAMKRQTPYVLNDFFTYPTIRLFCAHVLAPSAPKP